MTTSKRLPQVIEHPTTITSTTFSLADLTTITTPTAFLNAHLLTSLPSLSPTSPTSTPNPYPLPLLDKSLSTLLTQLESAASDTAVEVDDAVEEIRRGTGRVGLDLQLMRENAGLLKDELERVQREAASVGAGAGNNSGGEKKKEEGRGGVEAVLGKLKMLDTIKTRMTQSLDVLREAESWSTLDTDISTYLSETPPSYAKASQRLLEASHSLAVFQHTAEWESRRGLMRSLRNEVEAGLLGGLVGCVGKADWEGVKGFGDLFGMIERGEEFRGYYFGCRRTSILDTWKTFDPRTPDSPPLSEFLERTFYPALLGLLNAELESIPTIFPRSPASTLSAFLTTTLATLSPPTLGSHLTALAESLGPGECLNEVIKCWKCTERFGVATEHIFATLQTTLALEGTTPSNTNQNTIASPLPSPSVSSGFFPPGSPLPVGSGGKMGSGGGGSAGKERRSSKHMSISRRLSARAGTGRYSVSLTSPSPGGSGGFLAGVGEEEGRFFELLQKNGEGDESGGLVVKEWETALYTPFLPLQSLYPQLEAATLSSSNPVPVGLRTHPSPRAITDCLPGMFGGAEEAWMRCESFTYGFGSVGWVEAVDRSFERVFRAAVDGVLRGVDGGAGEGAEEALEGLDYSAEDWDRLQKGLRLLQACRTTSDRLVSFENKMRSTRLSNVVGVVRDAEVPVLAGGGGGGATKGAVVGLRYELGVAGQGGRELEMLLEAVAPPPPAPATLGRRVSTSAGGDATEPRGHGKSFSMASAAAATALRKELTVPTAPVPLAPPPPPPLFRQGRGAVLALTKACQSLVHTTILSPLMTHLSLYSTLPVLTATAASLKASQHSSAAFDLQMPAFSLSPTETMTRVGEGLFNLPRLFEVYADDPGLGFSVETLPFVDRDALLRSLGVQVSEALPSPPLVRKGPKVGESGRTQVQVHPRQAVLPTLSAETVISTWLSSLTLSVLSHLTTHVLPSIPRLTPHGAAQVASDLGYISNVAKALDVEGEEVERWREACEITGEGEGRRRVVEGGGEDEVLVRVGRMRGVG